jgi:hypothetical protein
MYSGKYYSTLEAATAARTPHPKYHTARIRTIQTVEGATFYRVLIHPTRTFYRKRSSEYRTQETARHLARKLNPVFSDIKKRLAKLERIRK